MAFTSLFRRKTTGKTLRSNAPPPTSAQALQQTQELQIPLHEISTAITPEPVARPTAPIKASRSILRPRLYKLNHTRSVSAKTAMTTDTTTSTSSFESFRSTISVSARSMASSVGSAKRRTMEFIATPSFEGKPIANDYDAWDQDEDAFAGEVIF